MSKNTGGLGIKNQRNQNHSLMMKWLRKLLNEEHMLWKEVITAKYGIEDTWMTKMVRTPYKCTVWREIRNLWPVLYYRTRVQVGVVLRHPSKRTNGMGKFLFVYFMPTSKTSTGACGILQK